MKVLVYSSRAYDQRALTEKLSGRHELHFTPERLSPESAVLAKDFDAVCLFTSDDASAPVLEKLHQFGVRYIALRSSGHDHADIEHAARLNLRIANAPDYSPYSVAEHAVALLMAVNRRILESQWMMQLQDFRLDRLVGFDVHGKTVGIIGTGKIGMAFARILSGFGVHLLAVDPVQHPQAAEVGIRYVTLDELLERSDIVSIHCPLTGQTRHLLNRRRFAQMKPGCVLINTSRGGIVNTADLIEALEQQKLGGAGLDVYEFERGLFFEDHRSTVLTDALFTRLRSFKNVLITGHQGFLTTEALDAIAAITATNLDSWEAGKRSPNELPEAKSSGQGETIPLQKEQ